MSQSVELPALGSPDDWQERQQRATFEAICRAASYATQSLIMACGTGMPRMVACLWEDAQAIERFIIERLCPYNGVEIPAQEKDNEHAAR